MISSQLALWMLVLAGAVASPDGIPARDQARVQLVNREHVEMKAALGPTTQEQRMQKRRAAGKATQLALLGVGD